jgi:GTP 3',8-cyclase
VAGLPIINQALVETEPLPARGFTPQPGWLTDAQGRNLKYLRLSVTDRCDLRCTYCMPEAGEPASPRQEVLSIEELVRVVQVFARMGVETLRLTGGEPLVRRGLETLIERVRSDVGIDDIALTTNASALAPRAKHLVQAGLTRLNVSLDSLRPEVFRSITRGGDLTRVLGGIRAAQDAGIGTVKINTVVVGGTNDDELVSIVEWAWSQDIVPRFIELMPLGAGATLGRSAVVVAADMRRALAHLIDVDEPPDRPRQRGPAAYYPARDGSGRKVGFISAVSENFCEFCNRVRVTARGDIRACLASPHGLSLRDLMRAGRGDDAIVKIMTQALYGKGEGHLFNVHGEDQHTRVAMSQVGG